MAVNFDRTLKKLAEVITTKDLGAVLFYEAAEYFETLDNPNSTYEEKHRANVLAEDLLSKIRDFPDLTSSNGRRRR